MAALSRGCKPRTGCHFEVSLALILKKEFILLWIVCKLFVRDTHNCCIFPSLLFHLWASVSNCLLKMVNLPVLLHKEFEIPTLRSKFFEVLNFVFLSEIAHKSFCVKFSGLTEANLKSSKNHIKVREYSTYRLIFSHFLKPKKFSVRQCSLPNYFASKTQKLSLRYYFS